MRPKVFSVLASVLVATAMVGWGAGTATADPPTVEMESLSGQSLICDETVITFTAGTAVIRSHAHETHDGLLRLIGSVVVQQATAVDEEGNTYRVVGSANFNFTTPDPEQEGGEVGHFIINLNIIGKEGLFGSVKLHGRAVGRSPQLEVSRGTCEFSEEPGEA
jgi:hypothetical protein